MNLVKLNISIIRVHGDLFRYGEKTLSYKFISNYKECIDRVSLIV